MKNAGVAWLCLALALMQVLPALAAGDTAMQERVVVLQSGVEPKALKRLAPRYPQNALTAGVESWVELQFDVNAEGQPENIEVHESGGSLKAHRDIEREAVRAVKKWRFQPATLNDEPVVRENVRQLITFQFQGGNGGVSRQFRGPFERASEAMAANDLEATRQAIEELESLQLSTMSQHAYLTMLKALYWQAAGNTGQALEQAERARRFSNEATVDIAISQVLRMTVVLNAAENNFHTALQRYDELLEEEPDLAPDDEIHELARQIRDILAGDQPIITAGVIEPCDTCANEAGSFTHDLNRGRLHVRLEEGALEKIRINCYPAHVTLAWQDDLVWNIANDPQDCSVNVYGDPGTRLTLVELADGAPAAVNPE